MASRRPSPLLSLNLLPSLSSLTSHQPGYLAMNQEFQAEVIAACKEHEEQNWRKDDYRACVYIGENYLVKYGAKMDLEPELATQEFIFDHAQQPQTLNLHASPKSYTTLSTKGPSTWWNASRSRNLLQTS